MSSKKGISFFQTTTFRLTLWYVGVFSLLSLVVFFIVYVSLAAHLQAQTDNEILDTAKEFNALYREHGVKALQSEFTREAGSRGSRDVFFQLHSPNGKLLAASDLSQWHGLKISRRVKPVSSKNQPSFRTFLLPDRECNVRIISISAADGNVIEIGSSLQHNEIVLERYSETFGTALIIMLICGALVGYLLAQKAMAGVQRVTDTAFHIGKDGLGRRAPLADEGAEINALAYAFNGMLERIESLLDEMRQITDNVAHELRTPVTRIRGMAEMTLKGSENTGDYREMAASVIDTCDDLIEMVNTMLEISKTDSGVAELSITPLDMREIIEEAADLFAPMSEDKHIDIRVIAPSQVRITGDRRRLQRVVANLLDNAIKYTPCGGTVTLAIQADVTGVKMEIMDTGGGINENDIPHIFDRFFRGDKSRSTAGSGLGLSLALAIVHAHGGDITVKNTGQGTAFSVCLPIDQPFRRIPSNFTKK